jgi:hypothetical protein
VIAVAAAKNDDVIRNPELEARLAEVDRIAEADARADREPQVLPGELGDLQDHYDDIYQQTLVEIATERASN